MIEIKFKAYDYVNGEWEVTLSEDVGLEKFFDTQQYLSPVFVQYTGLKYTGLSLQGVNPNPNDYQECYAGDLCMVDGIGVCEVDICPFYGVVFVDGEGDSFPVSDCIAESDSIVYLGNIHQNQEILK